MKFTAHLLFRMSLLASTVALVACNKSSSSQTSDEAPADIESAYMSLSSDLQKEIYGAEVMPKSLVREELLAKADKDGDGILSEEEKAALKAEWKAFKEKFKAEMKAALDKDKDGELSREEKKAGLDALGQKIKAAIMETLGEIRSAQEEARAKIKAACGKPESEEASLRDSGQKSSDASPADELDADQMDKEIEKVLSECQTVMQAEREKMQQTLKSALDALHAELEELKGKLGTVEEAKAS